MPSHLTKVMLGVERDCQTDSRKKILVNLRHQYGTALAVGADFIDQKLHIACDKAIANREKLFHAGFTMSSRRPDGQLRTVPVFKAVKAFLDMLE